MLKVSSRLRLLTGRYRCYPPDAGLWSGTSARSRTLFIKATKVTFDGDRANTGTQSSSVLIRAGAGGAGGALGYWHLQEYPADGCRKIQLRQRAGDAAQLAAYAQAFIQLHAPSTRVMALTGQTTAQGASSSGDRAAAQILFHSASLSGAD